MKALIFRETGEPKSVLQLADTPTPHRGESGGPGQTLQRTSRETDTEDADAR